MELINLNDKLYFAHQNYVSIEIDKLISQISIIMAFANRDNLVLCLKICNWIISVVADVRSVRNKANETLKHD